MTLIPVCAQCRTPLGPGMKVRIFHPDQWREFRRVIDEPDPHADDQPVAVCLRCGLRVSETLRQAQVQ